MRCIAVLLWMACSLAPKDTSSPDPDDVVGSDSDPGPPPVEGDADGDGYPEEVDCDDHDATVYPGAPEVCDDSKLNDCAGDPNDALEACGLTPWETLEGYPVLRGSASLYGAGYQIAATGDVSGDGLPDALVSCPDPSPHGAGVGAVFDPTRTDATTLGEASVATLEGVAYQHLGTSVGRIGDLDGDGYNDVSIGASATRSQYVFAGPLTGALPFSDAHVTLYGGFDYYNVGYSVAGPGDLDGDGRDDVLAAGFSANGTDAGLAAAFVFRTTFGDLVEATTADAILVAAETSPGDDIVVAAPGDLDGDGVPDLAISTPDLSTYTTSGGAVYLWTSEASGSQALEDADALLVPTSADAHAGTALVAAGDADGDGLADLVVGGYTDGSTSEWGRTWVALGGGRGTASLDASKAVILGDDAWNLSGFSAAADDYNQDGAVDLVIGNPASSQGATRSGAIYLFPGPLEGTLRLQTCDTRWAGGRTGLAGYALASPGDLDADGWPDLIVGAPTYVVTVPPGPGAIYLMSGASL